MLNVLNCNFPVVQLLGRKWEGNNEYWMCGKEIGRKLLVLLMRQGDGKMRMEGGGHLSSICCPHHPIIGQGDLLFDAPDGHTITLQSHAVIQSQVRPDLGERDDHPVPALLALHVPVHAGGKVQRARATVPAHRHPPLPWSGVQWQT